MRRAAIALAVISVAACDGWGTLAENGPSSSTTTTTAGSGGGGATNQGGGGHGAGGLGGAGGSGGGPINSNANCSPPTGAPGGLHFVEVASGFMYPIQLTHARGDSSRLYVVEKYGRIVLLKGGQYSLFLDITDRVQSGPSGDERGLLGVAFHPNYLENGRFFVHYSNLDAPGIGNGATVIEEYRRDPDNPDVADDTPVQLVLTAAQPAQNHNGGSIEINPIDGYLYIGLGDGGGSYDQFGNGQNPDTKLGKLLRIDIDTATPYAIPPGNVPGGEPTIYDTGLRNPYRWTFDVCTGDRYIGDVGQNCYEEVNIASHTGGPMNWGWPVFEAQHCLDPDGFANGLDCTLVPPTNCSTTGLDAAAVELTRAESTVVVAGHVYRGSAIPWLRGAFFYADFGGTGLWYLRWSNGLITEGPTNVLTQLDSPSVAAFGLDNDGELYIVNYFGAVYRVLPD